MVMNIDDIKRLIAESRIDEALDALTLLIEKESDDNLYYMRGNLYSKRSDWKHALSDYCKAVELNPESPAVEAYEALQRIMAFYNKDLYNP